MIWPKGMSGQQSSSKLAQSDYHTHRHVLSIFDSVQDNVLQVSEYTEKVQFISTVIIQLYVCKIIFGK